MKKWRKKMGKIIGVICNKASYACLRDKAASEKTLFSCECATIHNPISYPDGSCCMNKGTCERFNKEIKCIEVFDENVPDDKVQ